MIIPSRRILWLVALGLVPLALELTYRLLTGGDKQWTLPTLLAVGTYDAILGLLMVGDGIISARLTRLQAKRECSSRLSVGVANEIRILLENLSAYPLIITVMDHLPTTFSLEKGDFDANIPAHSWIRLPYQAIPSERGNFHFGDFHLRIASRFGLCWFDITLPASQPVQVYPNLLEVRHYEALVRTTLVRTGGYHRLRRPGSGKEFSHYRDYTVDDDYRNVSWTATARRGKPITAVQESEHSQDIIFCLDIGRMMAARVGKLTKLDHAINAVLMLTHVSQRFQDNLGLLIFSHEVHLYLPPSKGRSQYARFLQALYTIKPEYSHVNYREAFQYLTAHHPKRALTMVFTDLLDEVTSEEYLKAVRLLRRFHLPMTLAVADIPLQNLAQQTPDSIESMYNIQTARDLLQGRAEMLTGLEREGVLVVDTIPERLTMDSVNRYLALKLGGGR